MVDVVVYLCTQNTPVHHVSIYQIIQSLTSTPLKQFSCPRNNVDIISLLIN